MITLCKHLFTAAALSFGSILAAAAAAAAVPAQEIIAATLVLEAASDGAPGMQAVANVIGNRSRQNGTHPVGEVTKPKQFSALNHITPEEAVQKARRDRMWPVALILADLLLKDDLPDLTYGATHYHAPGGAYWSTSMRKTTCIGRHTFYR